MSATESTKGSTTPAPLERRGRPSHEGGTVLAAGEPIVWLLAGGLGLAVVMISGLLALILVNGAATFAVPSAVLCDLDLLRTLSDRDWRSGFAEAVKIAVIRDATLFDRIERDAEAIRDRDEAVADAVVRRSAELHLRHILEGGDPFELGTARPLDFGHWAAHRLEAMSGHRITHGEAVSIGVALDSTIAMHAGRLDEASHRRILDTLRNLGLPVAASELDDLDELLRGLEEFREHLGGKATIAMPSPIGASEDVPPPGRDEVARAITQLGSNWA